MKAMRNYKCVFGKNLYDTDETNSILEIRLILHCPISEEIYVLFLNVAVQRKAFADFRWL
jgi:hypothetical protein